MNKAPAEHCVQMYFPDFGRTVGKGRFWTDDLQEARNMMILNQQEAFRQASHKEFTERLERVKELAREQDEAFAEEVREQSQPRRWRPVPEAKPTVVKLDPPIDTEGTSTATVNPEGLHRMAEYQLHRECLINQANANASQLAGLAQANHQHQWNLAQMNLAQSAPTSWYAVSGLVPPKTPPEAFHMERNLSFLSPYARTPFIVAGILAILLAMMTL